MRIFPIFQLEEKKKVAYANICIWKYFHLCMHYSVHRTVRLFLFCKSVIAFVMNFLLNTKASKANSIFSKKKKLCFRNDVGLTKQHETDRPSEHA